MSLLYLTRRDVETVGVTMPDIIEALESMFREKGHGRVEMPPKPGIHPRPDSFIHAMPAYIPSLEAAGVKWIAGYPANQARGLPYISGLLILSDPDTGIPLAVMDAAWITAQRTGAATAVAARHMARPTSSRAGLIGCGVQGRSNLLALGAVLPIRHARVFDIHHEASVRYRSEMTAALDGAVEIEIVDHPRQAMAGADVVVTSGPILKDPHPTIEPGWLEPGAFACPLDFDSYWTGAAFREADLLVTDDVRQLDFYRQDGYFRDTPSPHADLGEIAAGLKPGRRTDHERTIALNLGLALEDVATAILVYRRALAGGIGRELPL